MRPALVVGLFELAGCHLVFELEDVPSADAPAGDPSCAPSGIQLCLTFEDELDDGATPDLSGAGNDAALIKVVRADRKSERAAALEMDSRISVTNINTLNFPGPLSFDAFFRWRGVFGQGEFVQAVIDNSNQWGSTVNNLTGYGCTFLFDDRPDSVITSGNLTAGVWHHLACVYDPAVGSLLYFDGVLKATDDRTIGGTLRTTASGGGRVHAGSFDTNTSKFIGDLDDVRVIEGVLTVDEILATVNAE